MAEPTAFVIPQTTCQSGEEESLIVHHPTAGRPIKEAGETVPLTKFIRRALRDGALEKGKAPSAAKVASAKPDTKVASKP